MNRLAREDRPLTETRRGPNRTEGRSSRARADFPPSPQEKEVEEPARSDQNRREVPRQPHLRGLPRIPRAELRGPDRRARYRHRFGRGREVNLPT